MEQRTFIEIFGYCSERDVPKLEVAIHNEDLFDCLSDEQSDDGINDWPNTVIQTYGTLATSNSGIVDIVRHLKKLVKIAPSLDIHIHVGDVTNSLKCVATIMCIEGEVTINPPLKQFLTLLTWPKIR